MGHRTGYRHRLGVTSLQHELSTLDALDAQDELAAIPRALLRPARARCTSTATRSACCPREAEAAVLEALEAWRTLGIDGWTSGRSAVVSHRRRARRAAGRARRRAAERGRRDRRDHRQPARAAGHLLPARRAANEDRGRRAGLPVRPVRAAEPDSAARLRSGRALVLVPSRDGRTHRRGRPDRAIEQPDVALAWLPSVLYRSGQLLDMPRLARAAARARRHDRLRLRALGRQRAASPARLGRRLRRVVHLQVPERRAWRGGQPVRARAALRHSAWPGRLVGLRQGPPVRHGNASSRRPRRGRLADRHAVGARRGGPVRLAEGVARGGHRAPAREVAGA